MDKISQINLAQTNIFLRYPNIELTVLPPKSSTEGGRVIFKTFVHNKDKSRICFVAREYSYNQESCVFEVLDNTRKVFKGDCERFITYGIFNKENTIEEPNFLINPNT